MIRLLSFAGALTALSVAAVAQSPQLSPGEGEIVVVGRNDPRPEKTFVESLAVPSRYQQLARFADPICPVAFGLIDEHAVRFAERIRRVAGHVGVPVAPQLCRPNLVVFIVPDRERALSFWRAKRPQYFDGMMPAQLASLIRGQGPVAAWQVVHLKGRGGQPIARVDSPPWDYFVVPNATPSRIGTQIELEFRASFVLIEAAAVADATLTQVADYAAMRALAHTDPQAAVRQPLPTVLSLFALGDHAPLSVTDWDVRYLKALYAMPLAANARDQQRAMARQVRNSAKAAER